MPSGKKRYVFEQDVCELAITRITPMTHSILIEQKCCICGKSTGRGYYSSTGKEREDRMNQKCINCINKAIQEIHSKDTSHTRKLSEN